MARQLQRKVVQWSTGAFWEQISSSSRCTLVMSGSGEALAPSGGCKRAPQGSPSREGTPEEAGSQTKRRRQSVDPGPHGSSCDPVGCGVRQTSLPYMQASRARDPSLYTFEIVSMSGAAVSVLGFGVESKRFTCKPGPGAEGAVGAPVGARGPDPGPWVWPSRAPSTWRQAGPQH